MALLLVGSHLAGCMGFLPTACTQCYSRTLMHMQLRHVTVRTLYIDFQFELLQLELITGCGLGAIWDCHLTGRLSIWGTGPSLMLTVLVLVLVLVLDDDDDSCLSASTAYCAAWSVFHLRWISA